MALSKQFEFPTAALTNHKISANKNPICNCSSNHAYCYIKDQEGNIKRPCDLGYTPEGVMKQENMTEIINRINKNE